MEPEDIYRKDQAPLFARRSGPPAGQSPALAPRIMRLEGSSRRSRRRRGARPATGANLALWVSLGFVVALYLGVLVYSNLRRPPPKPAAAAAPAAEPAPAPAPQGARDGAEVQKDLAARIRAWKLAEDAVEQANLLEHTGKFKESADRLRQALGAEPQHLDAQIELAEALVRQREFEEAERLLLKSLQADPDRMSSRLLLARVYAAQRLPEASLTVAQWMLEADPYSVEAHTLAAQAYTAMNQPAPASDHWKKVTTMQRDNLPALNALARTYSQMGRKREAVETLKKVLAADDKNSASYYNLAVCYAQENQIEDALDILDRAATLFGFSFVESWTQAGDFDGIRENAAFQEFQRALKAGGPIAPSGASDAGVATSDIAAEAATP